MLIGKADFNLSGNFKTLSQLRRYGLEKNLNEHSNGDIRLIRNEVQSRLGKNTKPTYKMKKIREMLLLVQNPERQKQESIIRLKF